MIDYELLDHTADIGVRTFGRDLKELFEASAVAMFDVIAEKINVTTHIKKKFLNVALSASGREELLVRWLSELLSLSDCENIFLTSFEISALSDTALSATATGYSRKYFNGKREIKAVTYHELKIVEKQGVFEAEIIFDV